MTAVAPAPGGWVPTQQFPPQGYPPQSYPPQGYAPQGYGPQGYGPPLQNNVNVVVTQTNKNGSGAGWFLAFLLLMITPPFGCIMIPVALVLIAFMMYFIPMIIGIAAASAIAKSPLPQDKKVIGIAVSLIAGVLLTGVWFTMLHPKAFTPPPSTTPTTQSP